MSQFPWMKRLVLEQQPDDVSCGPSCVRMVAGMLAGRAPRLDTFQVREMMGTSSRTGTTEREMEAGLRAFGIEHARVPPLEGAEDRMDDIVSHLRGGGLAMLRVMRDGCRHWMIGIGVDRDATSVLVADPDAGIEALPLDQLAEMLAPRGWEYWPIPATSPVLDLEIRSPGVDGMEEALPLLGQAIGQPGRPYNVEDVRIMLGGTVDWDLSQGLYADGRLVSLIALREATLEQAFELEAISAPVPEEIASRMEGLRSAWVIATACAPGDQGRAYGRLLGTMPGALGYEACFGFGTESPARIAYPWVAELGAIDLSAGPVAPLGPVMIADGSTVSLSEFPKPAP